MRNYIVLFLIIFPQLLCAGRDKVVISSQSQFDNAICRIENGEQLHIILKKGDYNLNHPVTVSASLCIEGRKAIIRYFDFLYEKSCLYKEEKGFSIYKLEEPLTPYTLFYDEKGSLLKVSESVNENVGVNYADEGIIADGLVDAGTLVKIPIPNNLSHLRNCLFSTAFGYFDCGWQTIKFVLEKSDESFFYCKTLNDCYTGDFSYDKRIYKKTVRFVLYNAEQQDGEIYYNDEYIYIPKGIKKVYCVKCANITKTPPVLIVKSGISIKGVTFEGFNGIEVNSLASETCSIDKCIFRNNLGDALRIVRKPSKIINEACVNNCSIYNCSLLSGRCLSLESINNGYNYFNITNCVVTRYADGKVGYKNPNGGVWVYGNATLIGNVVYNMPRCHMYFNKGIIVAKGNLLYNDDIFNSYIDRNFGEDWGLIYCNHMYKNTKDAIDNTEKNHILLENNLLYGAYGYVSFARGIYIDDGRGDVECRNNIILNTQFFSIDSRNVKMTEASSVRNRYDGNIVSTPYKLVAGSALHDENKPVTKNNVILNNGECEIGGIEVLAEDIMMDIDIKSYVKNGKVYVSQSLLREIKKSPVWRDVGKYIRITKD